MSYSYELHGSVIRLFNQGNTEITEDSNIVDICCEFIKSCKPHLDSTFWKGFMINYYPEETFTYQFRRKFDNNNYRESSEMLNMVMNIAKEVNMDNLSQADYCIVDFIRSKKFRIIEKSEVAKLISLHKLVL